MESALNTHFHNKIVPTAVVAAFAGLIFRKLDLESQNFETYYGIRTKFGKLMGVATWLEILIKMHHSLICFS